MEQEIKRGDSPTTGITNQMAGDGGFPAETETGELVSIVAKENAVNGVNKLIAADGRVFREPKLGEAPGLKDYDQGVPDDEPVTTEADAAAEAEQQATETEPETEPEGDAAA